MSDITTHTPGSFCWFELGTTDQNAAKQFYGSLAGWTAADFPMGPGELYTMFSRENRNAAACYALNAQMKAQGIPPNWLLYVSVEDADATAGKVTGAGGKLMSPPFDVMEFGRMAVCEDPTGAVFAIWQPKLHQGTGVAHEVGTFCWADLMSPDPAAAARFYGEVFGWQVDPGQDGSGYLHIKNGEAMIGGIPPAEHANPNAPPHWLLYLRVEDCDAATSQASASGASVFMAPMTMEKVGRWSVIADPQGAVLALFQPA
jgi:predicted enzyme related to lactoylglutathione lyase